MFKAIRLESLSRAFFLFLTAADRDAQLALRGYAVGAVDYLTKPFDPWVLRAKVSVFVELWTKTQQIKAQAEAVREREAQFAALADRVDEATRVLRGATGDADACARALEVLEQARWGG